MAAPKSAIPSFMGWSIPSDKIVSSQSYLAIFASKTIRINGCIIPELLNLKSRKC